MNWVNICNGTLHIGSSKVAGHILKEVYMSLVVYDFRNDYFSFPKCFFEFVNCF